MTIKIARTTSATRSTKPLSAAKVKPPKPIELAGTAEPPPVAIAVPPPPVPPPPYVLTPPGFPALHANALRGAQTANEKVSAPVAAALRAVFVTSNTVPEYNAESIGIRPG